MTLFVIDRSPYDTHAAPTDATRSADLADRHRSLSAGTMPLPNLALRAGMTLVILYWLLGQAGDGYATGCGCDIRLLAFITDPGPIRKILIHLGAPSAPADSR